MTPVTPTRQPQSRNRTDDGEGGSPIQAPTRPSIPNVAQSPATTSQRSQEDADKKIKAKVGLERGNKAPQQDENQGKANEYISKKRASKKEEEEEDSASKADERLGKFSPYAEEEHLAGTQRTQPGAESIPGVAAGQYSVDPMVYGSQAPDRGQGDNNLVQAFLVDEEAGGRPPDVPQDNIMQQQQQDDQNLPPSVAAKAVEYKPWYKRAPVLIALALLAAAVIGVVLGVTLRDSGGGNPVDTISPTSSPAPTAMGVITVVVQLDKAPQETGWVLECEGTELASVPEGSYAFLPIGVLIPSFRLEITHDVVVGSECVYNITDAGGNGLIGGFYEIYFGDDVGIRQNLIARGVPQFSPTIISFTAELPPAALVPTSTPVTQAPDSTPTTTQPPTSQGCTVCPDGSPVPNPDVFLEESGMTCGEIDESAKGVLNSTQCRTEIQALASDCGCENFCTTICPDGSLLDEAEENTLVRVDNGFPVTCGNIQDQVMRRNSAASECLTASFIGEEICSCPSEGNFCRICEPGGPSRLPGNLSREIIPGIACEDISGIAFSLLTSDPRFGVICPACLSIGAYCGCPQVENPRTFCRVCGGTKLLPVPDRLVFSPTLNQSTTCFHVEFFSNLGIAPNGTTSLIPDCSVVQNESAAECCV